MCVCVRLGGCVAWCSDGQRVVAEREGAYADLYHSLPWSHGSLGLLVGLTLKIIPVKKYVRVVYRPMQHTDVHTYCDAIREVSLATGDDVADFVEATVFSRTACVVMTGSFVDAPTEHGRIFLWMQSVCHCRLGESESCTNRIHSGILAYCANVPKPRKRLNQRVLTTRKEINFYRLRRKNRFSNPNSLVLIPSHAILLGSVSGHRDFTDWVLVTI